MPAMRGLLLIACSRSNGFRENQEKGGKLSARLYVAAPRRNSLPRSHRAGYFGFVLDCFLLVSLRRVKSLARTLTIELHA